MMRDTELAYELLFADPEWEFASSYRRNCLAKLQWSHLKTNLKLRDFEGTSKSIATLVNLKWVTRARE
jgi:hypothetical protein